MGFREKCFDRIRNFREAGKTILIVSHAMSDVAKHCERAILIDHGSIIADGPSSGVIAIYTSLMTPEVVGAH